MVLKPLPPMNAEGAAKVKLTLAKSAVEPQVSPALTAGYVALSSGDYPLAKRRYAEAIAANTNSADAHSDAPPRQRVGGRPPISRWPSDTTSVCLRSTQETQLPTRH